MTCQGCRSNPQTDLAFSMAFQPIVDVRTKRPFAHEALVRGLEELISAIGPLRPDASGYRG